MSNISIAGPESLASSVDVYVAFTALLKRAEKGEDVRTQIEQCLAILTERGCQTMEDALALVALAQNLYGQAIYFALTDTRWVMDLMLEADKHMRVALMFLEKHAGKTLPAMEAYRTALN